MPNLETVVSISLNVLFLLLGFFLLAKGADFFVDGASSVAKRFKIPQIVIGLTIVAMGTSMPEAAVSIKAAISGNADISIGNVVGSNILNILLILGVSSVIFPLVIKKFTQRIDIPIVMGASLILLVLGFFGKIFAFLRCSRIYYIYNLPSDFNVYDIYHKFVFKAV